MINTEKLKDRGNVINKIPHCQKSGQSACLTRDKLCYIHKLKNKVALKNHVLKEYLMAQEKCLR